MKIALAQINPIVGNIRGNTDKILLNVGRAKESGAELVIFPEMAVTGYPPRDLLERPYFIDENLSTLVTFSLRVRDIAMIVGFVDKNPEPTGRPLYNAAALIENGEISSVHYKSLLPTYDVFDEDRYFEPAAGNMPVKIGSRRTAITICEDIWTDEICGPRKRYHRDPLAEMAKKKMNLIVNLSASPYAMGKDKQRETLMKNLAVKYQSPVAFCNQVGGNDELVFDGNSMVVDAAGNVIARGRPFGEDLVVIDLDAANAPVAEPLPDDIHSVYQAMVLGTRDYAHKCGFRKAVVGLSGGIDSALVACVATAALGAQNVLGVAMPSQFNAATSLTDAEALAKNLGIEFKTVPIQNIYGQYLEEFHKLFAGTKSDTTEENIQARIRGNILMAISNKQGHLVLSTGNKSEISTGYCTLYGDMAGGLAVISDVPKTLVYRLAREVVNRERAVIPESIVTKAPSAELRPHQKDSDTLPEYDVLDPILKAYIEDGLSAEQIVAQGFDAKIVGDVVRRVEVNEYKRRQAAPGLKVTSKAFGYGRRIPIAHHVST